MKYTVISTFAGCGGSSLGYKWAGFKELLAIDFDKNAVETFKLNFDVPIWQKDIKEIMANEILEFCNIEKGELDVLDGSPPCQGFSTAGKRQVNDNRNDLFKEFVRLINGLQPKVFVMENVSGMIKGKMKGMFIEIMKTLKGLNYQVKCKLMNAKYYNVPQSRERVIFIGVRNDLNIEPSYPEPNNKLITIKDLLPIKITNDDIKVTNSINWNAKPYCYFKSVNLKPEHNLGEYYKGKYFSYGIISNNKPCPTIQKSMANPKPKQFMILDNKIHNIPENLIKLCGSYLLSFKYKLFKEPLKNYCNLIERIGNSVPPKFMQAIAENIKINVLNKYYFEQNTTQ